MLTKRALRFQVDDPQIRIQLLEKGLQTSIPERTKAIVMKQPSIRVAEGILLEFSDPSDLNSYAASLRFENISTNSYRLSACCFERKGKRVVSDA